MKKNPRLKPLIMSIVDNQLRENNPPETRVTLKRLVAEGYSEQEARELIACVVTSEIYDIMKKNEMFNLKRFVDCLNKLPKLPWD